MTNLAVDKGQVEVIKEVDTLKTANSTCEQRCMIFCHDCKSLLIHSTINLIYSF